MTISVAIIEDDHRARKILATRINEAPGLRLVADWGDAETALRLLPAHKPDVVLMDINLPGISGVEAIRLLKPTLPGTQFLVLTVYEDENHIYNALAAGASGYLLKQSARDELLAAVRDIHQGGSPITSNIARKVVQFFRSQNSAPSISESLSPREREVLELVTQGRPYKEIGDMLKISIPTVSTYVRRTYEKLHVCSRAQAVAKYARLTHAEPETRKPGG